MRLRILLGVILCSALGLSAAPLSAAPPDPVAPDPAGPPALEVPAAARAHDGFDVEAATAAYLGLLPPAARARSDAYFEGGYWIDLGRYVLGLAVALFLLAGGRAARLRAAVRTRVRRRYLADTLTAGALLIAIELVTLPLESWVGFVREHAYGLSNQHFAAWLGEWAKGAALALAVTAPLIGLFYLVVRRAPRNWWLWGTGVAVVALAFLVLLAPVFVAPLFNRYRPLEPGPLRDSILSMARAHRVPATDVYWFDASKQTSRISANVSGLAGTTRISLNDNLLRRSPPETVRAVMGHELGHYVLAHVTDLILQLALVLAAGFGGLHWGFEAVRRRLGRGWALEGREDVAGLPLALALLSTFFLLVTPLTNTIVRRSEAEADAFGLAVAREPDGFAYAAVQLAEYRKMEPGPLEEILFYDHPSGYDRIRRAMEWKAEHLAELAARERAAR